MSLVSIDALYDSIAERIEAVGRDAALPTNLLRHQRELFFEHWDQGASLRMTIGEKLHRSRAFQVEVQETQILPIMNWAEHRQWTFFNVLVGYQIGAKRSDAEKQAACDRRLIANALLLSRSTGSDANQVPLMAVGDAWPAPLRGPKALLLVMPFRAQHSERSSLSET